VLTKRPHRDYYGADTQTQPKETLTSFTNSSQTSSNTHPNSVLSNNTNHSDTQQTANENTNRSQFNIDNLEKSFLTPTQRSSDQESSDQPSDEYEEDDMMVITNREVREPLITVNKLIEKKMRNKSQSELRHTTKIIQLTVEERAKLSLSLLLIPKTTW